MITIYTLGEPNMLKYAIANYFGLDPNTDELELCKIVKDKKESLLIANIFAGWISFKGQDFRSSQRMIIDIGMEKLRMLVKHKIPIYLEDTDAIDCDLDIVKTISPPLFENLKKFKVEK